MSSKLNNKAKASLAVRQIVDLLDGDYKVTDVEALSDNEYDLSIEGTHKLYGSEMSYSAWLPKLAISGLVDWSSPEVASMTDYPEMAFDGDWSAVRDSSEEAIWAIFNEHVMPILDEIRKTRKTKTDALLASIRNK